MGRNTTAMKRGWNYDKPNARMDCYVDGTKFFHLDPTNTEVFFDAIDIQLGDDDYLRFGDATNGDVQVCWNGSLLQFLPATDDTGYIAIGNGTKDMDLRVYLGTAAKYVLFDVGNVYLSLEDVDLRLGDNDEVKFGDGSGGDVRVAWNGSSLNFLPLTDDTGYIAIGNGSKDLDLKVYLGTSAKYVLFDVGNSYLNLTQVQIYAPNLVTTGVGTTAGTLYVNANGYVIQSD